MSEHEALEGRVSRDRGRTPLDEDYGLGEHAIDCDALGMLDEDQLTVRLVEVFEAPGYQPPRLPKVAMDLVALSRNPSVEFRELEELLEQDATLAGQVLSIARSAYYAGTGEVNSLHTALVRLGLDKLRDVVMQAAMNLRVFRCDAYRACMERLQFHSRAVSHVSRIVARQTPIDEERAFLCGLMHDVGIAGILLALSDGVKGRQPPDLAVLWPAIDRAHPRAGALMVKLWDLHPEIPLAVGAHHQVSIDGYDHPLAAAVCAAEALAVEMHLGFTPTAGAHAAIDATGLTAHGRVDCSDQAVVHRAHEALGLSGSALDAIRGDVVRWQTEGAVTV